MALINCKECNSQISNKAKVCPHCGAAVKTSPHWVYAVITLGAVMVLGNCVGQIQSAFQSVPNPESASVPFADDKYQSNSPSSPSLETPPQPSPAEVLAKIEEFNAWLHRVDPEENFLISAQVPQYLEPEKSRGIVEVTVSDSWHTQNKQQRLLTAQDLRRQWARFYSPQKPNLAHLWLVDRNGNRVGGSDWLGSMNVID